MAQRPAGRGTQPSPPTPRRKPWKQLGTRLLRRASGTPRCIAAGRALTGGAEWPPAAGPAGGCCLRCSSLTWRRDAPKAELEGAACAGTAAAAAAATAGGLACAGALSGFRSRDQRVCRCRTCWALARGVGTRRRGLWLCACKPKRVRELMRTCCWSERRAALRRWPQAGTAPPQRWAADGQLQCSPFFPTLIVLLHMNWILLICMFKSRVVAQSAIESRGGSGAAGSRNRRRAEAGTVGKTLGIGRWQRR